MAARWQFGKKLGRVHIVYIELSGFPAHLRPDQGRTAAHDRHRSPGTRGEAAVGAGHGDGSGDQSYSELEAEGFIYSIPGKGSFASRRGAPDGSHGQDPAREAKLIQRLRELVAELRYLNYTDSEIVALMREGEGQ